MGYSDATMLPVERGEVWVVTCRRCGAAILQDSRNEIFDPKLNPIALHDSWHEEQDKEKKRCRCVNG